MKLNIGDADMNNDEATREETQGEDGRQKRAFVALRPETRRKLRMCAALRDVTMIDAVEALVDEDLARRGIPSRSEGDAQG